MNSKSMLSGPYEITIKLHWHLVQELQKIEPENDMHIVKKLELDHLQNTVSHIEDILKTNDTDAGLGMDVNKFVNIVKGKPPMQHGIEQLDEVPAAFLESALQYGRNIRASDYTLHSGKDIERSYVMHYEARFRGFEKSYLMHWMNASFSDFKLENADKIVSFEHEILLDPHDVPYTIVIRIACFTNGWSMNMDDTA